MKNVETLIFNSVSLPFKAKMDSHHTIRLFHALVLLLIFLSFEIVLSAGSSRERALKRTLLQSSNSENFCLKTPSPQNHHDNTATNETCATTTTFQLSNISQLSTEYPVISHSLPIKNSSRFFCSKRSSASLTISIKSFKYEVMFLNFSYFIGKTDITELPALHPLSYSDIIIHDTKLLSVETQPVNRKEKATSIKLYSLQPSSPVVMTNNQPTVTQTLLSELNQPSLSISISSPPSEIETEAESILIKHDNSRKRRSVILENISNAGNTASSSILAPAAVLTGKLKSEIKPTELTVTEKFDKGNSNETLFVSKSTPNSGNKDVSVSNIDSLTLVQAVEMIKSAAAAISQGNVASVGSLPKKMVTATGHTHTSSNSESSSGNNVKVSNGPATATEKIITVHATTIPTSKPNRSNQTDIKGTAEIMAQANHKSKNTSSRNENSEEDTNQNRDKRNNAERSEKDENSDDGDNDRRRKGSSSSSSSSEEEINKHEERSTEIKPKISYKMWRASFEKENRPPGLYVTINEDIIFDSWDGIWDKHFVLGKWTGTKAPLDSKKWNYTNIFLNLNDGATPERDLQITFEWEPINENTELILTDVEVSTLVSPSTPCSFPEKSEKPRTQGKGKVGQTETSSKENGRSDSLIVLKPDGNRKEGWEVVKLFKTQSSTSGENEPTHLRQHSTQHSPHSDKRKTKSDTADIIHEIFDQIHDDVHSSKGAELKNSISDKSKTSTIENTSAPILRNTVAKIVQISADFKNKSSESDTNSSTSSSKRQVPLHKVTDIVPNGNKNIDDLSTKATFTSTLSTTSPLPISTTTTMATTPLTLTSGTSIPSTKRVSSNLLSPIDAPTITLNSPNKNVTAQSKASKIARKTDSGTALIVTGFTGFLALTILVVVLKRRFDISFKSRNAVR